MRRTLLLLAGAVVLMLPAAAAARRHGKPAPAYLVVRNASTDGGVTGKPVATVVVQGFVLGHIAQEGAVQMYQLGPTALVAQGSGADVTRHTVAWHTNGAVVPGTEFSGSDFRFRAVGGVWRVVVYGAGVSLYAASEGSNGSASLHGSVGYPGKDGTYSFDGGPFASLPSGVVKRRFGGK